MFLRSFLLAILVAALLGSSSACLTESQVASLFKKNNAAMEKKWAKAKNAKTCDDAIKYAMKNSMERPTADNMAAFVQLGSELVDALEKADGNIKKMYASYTKECSGPWNKGLKKQGYTKLGGSAYEKCIEKNRSVDDYRRSIKEFIKQAKAMLQDEDVLPSLILAMAKVPALGPLFKVAMNMA